jgi:hypothetical protein
LEKTADNEKRSSGGAIAEDVEVRPYTRLEAARCQLEMAVRARLQFNDPVSALTLAGAAEKVLGDLQPRDAVTSNGHVSIRAFVNEHCRSNDRKKVEDAIRLAYDQLRHADRPGKGENYIHNLESGWVDGFLGMCVYAFSRRNPSNEDFAEWFNSLPPVLGVFLVWSFLTDPRTWARASSTENFDSKVQEEFMRLPQLSAFEALLELVESKSLVPNPKSLERPNQ